MGGFGSGRRFCASAKSTNHDLLSVDVRSVLRERTDPDGNLFVTKLRNGEPCMSAEIELRLGHVAITIYSYEDQKRIFIDRTLVDLVETHCHFGSSRQWFACPAHRCGRRVAILYVGRCIACRHCHDLAYRSTRQSGHDRQLQKLFSIRRKLDWPEGLQYGPGRKPKWMRWATFFLLLEQHNRIAEPLVDRLKSIYLSRR